MSYKLDPVIHTPLLDRMSIQLQFTLRNTAVGEILTGSIVILQVWIGGSVA